MSKISGILLEREKDIAVDIMNEARRFCLEVLYHAHCFFVQSQIIEKSEEIVKNHIFSMKKDFLL